jgi:hypothetical protein
MKLTLLTLVAAALATAQNLTSTATDPPATDLPSCYNAIFDCAGMPDDDEIVWCDKNKEIAPELKACVAKAGCESQVQAAALILLYGYCQKASEDDQTVPVIHTISRHLPCLPPRLKLLTFTADPTEPVSSHTMTHSVPDSDETCSPVTVTATGGLLPTGSWPVVSASAPHTSPPYPTAPQHQTGVTPFGTVPTGTVSLPIVTPSGTAPTDTGVIPTSGSPSSTPPPEFSAAAVAINAPAVYAGMLGLVAYLF